MKPIIGIDLGTTTSVIAHFKDGAPIVLKNPKSGNELTPSVVGLDPKSREMIVGEQADGLPEAVIHEIKRKMGTTEKVKLGNDEHSPEDISAMILRELKNYGEELLGMPISEAVITVPANFSIEAKKATEIAAELAGLRPLRIIQEPTSAALAYGVNQDGVDEKVLVYDLGGGTFDVSVVEIVDGNIDVLAHDGERHLGGKDFDERIVEHANQHLQSQHGLDVSANLTAMFRLKRDAKKIKEELSSSHQAAFDILALAEHKGETIHLKLDISRAQFEQLIADLIEKTLTLTQAALRKAKVKKEDIRKVLLVGGSTKIPYVRDAVESFFGFPAATGIEPDLAVAMGAAIQSAIINGEFDKFILDRVAYGFGIEVVGDIDGQLIPGVYSEIIEPNSPMLKTVQYEYRTISDDQTRVELHCFQREPSNTSMWTNDCLKIGDSQLLDGIPPAPAGDEAIEVGMTYNLDGIITLKAVVKSTGAEKEFQVQTATAALNDEQMEARKEKLNKMWQKSKYADKAKAMIHTAEKRMAELSNDDAELVQSHLDELKAALIQDDLDKIEETVDKIADILSEY